MRWPVIVVLGVASACYSPSYQDCLVSCASGVCPSGLECIAGVCRAPGMTGPCTGTAMADASRDGAEITGIPIAMLFDAQLTALCDFNVRCGMFEDATVCKQVFSNFTQGTIDLPDAVTAGKVLYDALKARECVDSLATYSCDRWRVSRPSHPACYEIFGGTLDASATCTHAEECKSRTCVKDTCSMACCTGQCAAGAMPGARTLNQPCTRADYCVGGYCELGATGSNGVCVAYKTQGMQCTSDIECADSLGCRMVGANMACETLVAVNGPCTDSYDCAQLSNVCLNNMCRVGGLTGSPCDSSVECQSLHPCDMSAGVLMCKLPPAIGDSCANYPFCRTGYCPPGVAGAMCTAKVPDGSPCDPLQGGQQCQSGFCDGTTVTCVTQDCF